MNTSISPAELCTADLTSPKRAIIQSYLEMVPLLRKRHGRKPAYEPDEVRGTAAACGCNFDHISWAFMLYCGPSVFRQMHAAPDYSYTAMHGAVAGTFFQGDLNFDLFGAGDGQDVVGNAIFGAPLDVDLSGLAG